MRSVIVVALLAALPLSLPANMTACQHWFGNWVLHSGGLPGASSTHNRGNANVRTFSVTSNIGGTSRTVNGVGWCGGSTTPPTSATQSGSNCWCRVTSPITSRWVFESTHSSNARCAGNCSDHCASCVREGNRRDCRRHSF